MQHKIRPKNKTAPQSSTLQLEEDRLLKQASSHLVKACQCISRLVELCYPWNPGLNEAKRGHHGLHTPMSASSLEAAAHGCILEMFQLHKNCTDSPGSLALTCINAARTAWLQHALVPRRALACATQPFIESLSHQLNQNLRYQSK